MKGMFGYQVYLHRPDNMPECQHNKKIPCSYEEPNERVCLYCLLGYYSFCCDQFIQAGGLFPFEKTQIVANAVRMRTEATKAMVDLLRTRIPELQKISDRILGDLSLNSEEVAVV